MSSRAPASAWLSPRRHWKNRAAGSGPNRRRARARHSSWNCPNQTSERPAGEDSAMANILVVEGYPPSLSALTAALALGNHRVVEANDGVEALAKARAEHFLSLIHIS